MERRRAQPKPSENNSARNIIMRSYRLAQRHYEKTGNALSLEASQTLDTELSAFHQQVEIEAQIEEMQRSKGKKSKEKIKSTSSERTVTGPSKIIRDDGKIEHTWDEETQTRRYTKTLIENMGKTEGVRFQITQLSRPGEPYAALTYYRLPGEKGKMREVYWLEMGKTDKPPLVKVQYDKNGHAKQILQRVTPDETKPLQGYDGDTLVASDRNYDAAYLPIDIVGRIFKRFSVSGETPKKFGDKADFPSYTISVNNSGFYIYLSVSPKENPHLPLPDAAIYIPWSLNSVVIKGLLTDNSEFNTARLLEQIRTSCTSKAEDLVFNSISSKE